MNLKKILCPIDFSDFNQHANEIASTLASANGASIVYLTVPPQGASSDDYGYAMEREKERALEKLVSFEPSVPGVEFSHEVQISILTGKTIVEFAEENDVDLIVMATHGRTGLRRLMMGSVTEYVVRNATCEVLTVKPTTEPAKPTAATMTEAGHE